MEARKQPPPNKIMNGPLTTMGGFRRGRLLTSSKVRASASKQGLTMPLSSGEAAPLQGCPLGLASLSLIPGQSVTAEPLLLPQGQAGFVSPHFLPRGNHSWPGHLPPGGFLRGPRWERGGTGGRGGGCNLGLRLSSQACGRTMGDPRLPLPGAFLFPHAGSLCVWGRAGEFFCLRWFPLFFLWPLASPWGPGVWRGGVPAGRGWPGRAVVGLGPSPGSFVGGALGAERRAWAGLGGGLILPFTFYLSLEQDLPTLGKCNGNGGCL